MSIFFNFNQTVGLIYLKCRCGPESKRIASASGKSKKKRAGKKPSLNGNEGSDKTNLEDQGFNRDDTTENLKACKSLPRNNRCTLPLVDVQVKANFDEAEVFNGNYATLPKKRKIKGRSKMYRDGGPTLIDEEIEAFDLNDAVNTKRTLNSNDAANKEQALTPCSPDLSAISHSPPPVDERLELRTEDGDGVEALGGDNNTEEGPIRCSTPDILDSLNPRASIICLQKGKKRPRKRGKNSSYQILEKEGGDDITLASFLQQTKKHRKLAAFCSEKIPKPKRSRAGEGEDGDDTTLASFCSKLKKRKREVAKNGN